MATNLACLKVTTHDEFCIHQGYQFFLLESVIFSEFWKLCVSQSTYKTAAGLVDDLTNDDRAALADTQGAGVGGELVEEVAGGLGVDLAEGSRTAAKHSP